MTCVAAVATVDLRRRPDGERPGWLDGDAPAWANVYDDDGRLVSGIEHDRLFTRYVRKYRTHRDGDLPAKIWASGELGYFRDGDLHRDGDKPAVIYPSGRLEFHVGGGLHRHGGPAVIDPGTLGFPLDECAQINPGVAYHRWCLEEFSARAGGPRKGLNGEHRVGAPSSYALDGSWERWCQRGRLHRLDGPALRHPDGRLEWYRDGRLHRDGAPAVQHPDGRMEYWRDGVRHRDDGPAVITAKGRGTFYVDGIKVPNPGKGRSPAPAQPAGFEVVTCRGRRFRLGRRLTDTPKSLYTALDIASQRRDLRGGEFVLRGAHGYVGDGPVRLEKAYDTRWNGWVMNDDGRYHVYEAELVGEGETYPQPTQDPGSLPAMPDAATRRDLKKLRDSVARAAASRT